MISQCICAKITQGINFYHNTVNPTCIYIHQSTCGNFIVLSTTLTRNTLFIHIVCIKISKSQILKGQGPQIPQFFKCEFKRCSTAILVTRVQKTVHNTPLKSLNRVFFLHNGLQNFASGTIGHYQTVTYFLLH